MSPINWLTIEYVYLNDDSVLFDRATIRREYNETIDDQFSFMLHPWGDGEDWGYLMDPGIVPISGIYGGREKSEKHAKHAMMMTIKKHFPEIYEEIKRKYMPCSFRD